MAGYNRGIVATRKLNKENKARLGRRGDTEIRKVEGKDSHVNALEAYLIDVDRKAGEDYAKRVGAGTTNPLTGMPEYHTSPVGGDINHRFYLEHDDSQHTHANTPAKYAEYSSDWPWGPEIPNTLVDWETPEGRQDYETLAGYTEDELEVYLKSEFDLGKDRMQYIEGFKEEPFDFLKDQQALTERGLKSAYGDTMGALAGKEKTLGLQMEGIGRTAGRGLSQATGAASTAASRSGLATSGTITSGLEAQTRGLFEDYTADVKGVEIGMGDVRREKGTAAETLQLGVEGADLDYRQAEYAEKQRQLDELYADVGAANV